MERLEMPQAFTVRQNARPIIPSEYILLSNHGAESANVILEQHARPATEHAVPALDEHTLLLVLGQPVRMMQQRDGHRDERQVQSGDLLLAPAGMEAHCRWDSTLHLLHLRLPQLFLTQVAAESGFAHPERLELINQFHVRDPQIEQIMRMLQTEVQSNDPGERLSIEALTNLLAIQLLRNYSNSTGRERTTGAVTHLFLRRVTDYINDNLDTQLALAEIAAIAGMSPYHFGRTFKRATGITPHQYVIRQRVERAKTMLLSTDQTIGEIACAVGFYDQGHLARHMRSLLGVSPQMLRNRKNIR